MKRNERARIIKSKLPAGVAAASLVLFATGCGQESELSGVSVPAGAEITGAEYVPEERHVKIAIEPRNPTDTAVLDDVSCGMYGTSIVASGEGWASGKNCFVGDVSQGDSEQVIQDFRTLAEGNQVVASEDALQSVEETYPQQSYDAPANPPTTNGQEDLYFGIYSPAE